jgi:surfactin synthase thioesterase subunit
VGYRYQPGPQLSVPLSLINGRQDPHIGAAQLVPWRREYATPAYHWADGGHFYFEQQPSAVTDVLRAAVLADQHVEVI